MVTFRVGAYDADVLEKEFAPQFYADDLVNLGKYQIYLKLMIDDMGSKPFSATTLPPIESPEFSYKQQVIEQSRKTFSVKRDIVEGTITEEHATHEEARKEAHKEASAAGQKKSEIKREVRRPEQKRHDKAKFQKEVFKENEQSNHKEKLAEIAGSLQKKNNLPPKKKVDTEQNKADLKSALADVLKNQKKSEKKSGSQDGSRGTKEKASTNGEVSNTELKKVLDIEGDNT